MVVGTRVGHSEVRMRDVSGGLVRGQRSDGTVVL